MPVLVTGAHRPIARRVALRLLDLGGEVRVHGRGDLGALRAAGAIVAAGDADDEGHLESALAQIHTAIHVGRGAFAPSADTLTTEAEVLARAAAGAEVRRVVALSVAGADPGAPDPFHAAMGEVEQVLAAAPTPSVVVRTSLVDTPAVRDALATAGLSTSEREVEVAPVRPDDLVALLVAFDELRGSATSGHATFLADGPRRMTLDRYLDRVGVARAGSGSLVGRRALDPRRTPLLLPSLHGPWVSAAPEIAAQATPDAPALPDAWAFTGVSPLPPGP